MKKMIMTLVIGAATIGSAYADSIKTFYSDQSGNWSIRGVIPPKDSTYNPMCQLITKMDNNSFVVISKDLVDGELLIEGSMKNWSIEPSSDRMQFVFYNKNNSEKEVFGANFKRWDETDFQLRAIKDEAFLTPFMSFDVLMILVEDNNWLTVGLEGSRKAITESLPKCMKTFKRANRPSING